MDDGLASLLRRQVIRLHTRVSRNEEKWRAERLELESSLAAARREAQLLRSCLDAEPSGVRELVEEAVAKAAAARRDCEDLRGQLEETRQKLEDAERANAEATSMKRALHNLNLSFDEQERRLKTSLADSDVELERHRQTKVKCTGAAHRLAETLRELMITLADEAPS